MIKYWLQDEKVQQFAFLVFTFYLVDYFLRKIFSITEKEIFDYVEENIDDYSFRMKIQNMILPRVGEIVQMANSPWNGLYGYITKINGDNYNIKLTKSLNPLTNRIPKKRITRPITDIYID